MSPARLLRPRRATVIAATLAILTAGIGAAPAAAGLSDFTFETEVGGCAGGYGASNQQIDVILKDGSGTTLASDSTYTEFGTGYWQLCLSQPVRGGQQLTVRYHNDGSHERTVVVPKVTASLDRATNVAKGTATPGADLMLELTTCVPGDCSIVSQVDITVPGSGSWSRTYNAANPGGGDKIRAYRVSGLDRFYAQAYAPQVVVRATQPWNVSLIARKGTFTIKDLKPNGDVRASIRTTFDAPGFKLLPFLKKGKKASPLPGDRIVGTGMASDMSMKLPPFKVTVDLTADTVSARCFPSRAYQVLVSPIGSTGLELRGNAAADGTVFESDVVLDAGGTVVIECEDAHGDRLRLKASVPAPLP